MSVSSAVLFVQQMLFYFLSLFLSFVSILSPRGVFVCVCLDVVGGRGVINQLGLQDPALPTPPCQMFSAACGSLTYSFKKIL